MWRVTGNPAAQAQGNSCCPLTKSQPPSQKAAASQRQKSRRQTPSGSQTFQAYRPPTMKPRMAKSRMASTSPKTTIRPHPTRGRDRPASAAQCGTCGERRRTDSPLLYNLRKDQSRRIRSMWGGAVIRLSGVRRNVPSTRVRRPKTAATGRWIKVLWMRQPSARRIACPPVSSP